MSKTKVHTDRHVVLSKRVETHKGSPSLDLRSTVRIYGRIGDEKAVEAIIQIRSPDGYMTAALSLEELNQIIEIATAKSEALYQDRIARQSRSPALKMAISGGAFV